LIDVWLNVILVHSPIVCFKIGSSVDQYLSILTIIQRGKV